MSDEGRITAIGRNVKSGSGGRRRLNARPPYTLAFAAKAYACDAALLSDVKAQRERAVAAGLETPIYDSAISDLAERAARSASHAEKAFHETGSRWSVVVWKGWYVYLSESQDDVGRRIEPVVVAGRMSGETTCPQCKGSRRNGVLTDDRCSLCKGAGEVVEQLPAAVREAVEREAADARAAMIEQSDAFVMEGAANVD